MVLTLSKVDVIAEKLVEYVARAASRIRYNRDKLMTIAGSSLYGRVVKVISRVAEYIVEDRNGLLWCRLCNKGPFTKRGLYLHLVRVHSYEIKLLIEDELSKEVSKA